MTKEARLQVERNVVEVLGDLFGNYYQISKINNQEKELLESIGIDPDNKNREHDAGGINDDWPVRSRGVYAIKEDLWCSSISRTISNSLF